MCKFFKSIINFNFAAYHVNTLYTYLRPASHPKRTYRIDDARFLQAETDQWPFYIDSN